MPSQERFIINSTFYGIPAIAGVTLTGNLQKKINVGSLLAQDSLLDVFTLAYRR